jgi:hypothetical protein
MLKFVGIDVLSSFGLFGPITLSDEDVKNEMQKVEEILKGV